MRVRAAVLAVVCGAAMPAPALAGDVVISEVYGGGGNSGAPLRSDFVELFNRGEAAVSVAGWKVGYASAAGTSWAETTLSGSIAPGGRFLVKQADGANTAAPALPAPDATGTAAMSGTAGKVRLVDAAGARADLVAYGSSATPFEGGGPAPGLSNSTSASRKVLGCQDTDDNAADFTAGEPAPQNASTAPTSCSGPQGAGAASPREVPAGATTTLTVLSQTATSVTADLRAIGGNERQALANPEGDESFTFEAPVPAGTAPGARSLPVALRDAAGRTGTTAIALTVLEGCDAPATAISAVQGAGTATPRAGEVVAVSGVVVGDFQQPGGLGGFHLQSLVPDDDPATSEGLFVFSTRPVAAGDVVRVRGRATEFGGLTQLDRVEQATVCASGRSVAPTVVDLPAAEGDLERLEGMAVRFTERLTVTEAFTLARFGEVLLAEGGRLFTPTNLVPPGPAAQALAEENERRSILLDDGSGTQNPAVVRYPPGGLSATSTLRSGDSVAGLTGVLDERFQAHRVQPTGDVAFERTNPRPAAPPPVGGNVRVAAFNVLNFFDGPSFPTPRGADDERELERQTQKEVAALAGLDADVVGLMELENDEGGAVQTLVRALNAEAGAGTYDAIDTGVVGTDEIRVALLFKPGAVRPVGRPAILDSSVDPRFLDTRNRPSIAQSFEVRSTLETVTVVVNHLKSKGSACAGDPDTGDGQGNCNGTRVAAAQALADWLAGDPTRIGHRDALVIGDLNSYAEEDPIRALRAAGYVDEIRRWNGPGAYSYVFDGQAGHLDHALASASLSPRVRRVVDWHINADEPIALDYNTEFKTPEQVASFFAPTPYRSSDHDPLLAGLGLTPTYAGQMAAVRRHVTKPGVRDALLAKLEAGALQAYRNQLAAQAGKAVPEAIAAVLIASSREL